MTDETDRAAETIEKLTAERAALRAALTAYLFGNEVVRYTRDLVLTSYAEIPANVERFVADLDAAQLCELFAEVSRVKNEEC